VVVPPSFWYDVHQGECEQRLCKDGNFKYLELSAGLGVSQTLVSPQLDAATISHQALAFACSGGRLRAATNGGLCMPACACPQCASFQPCSARLPAFALSAPSPKVHDGAAMLLKLADGRHKAATRSNIPSHMPLYR
jgi:hypothetical protein